MAESRIEDFLAGMSPNVKKGMLSELVSGLLGGLSDAERKNLIQTLFAGPKEGQRLSSMVER